VKTDRFQMAIAVALMCAAASMPVAQGQALSAPPASFSAHSALPFGNLLAGVSNDIGPGGAFESGFWHVPDGVLSASFTPPPWGGNQVRIDDISAGVTAPSVPHQSAVDFTGWSPATSYNTNNHANPTFGMSSFRFQLAFDSTARDVDIDALYWESLSTPATPFFQAHLWIDGAHYSAMNISLLDQAANPLYAGDSDLLSSGSREYLYFLAMLPAGFELSGVDLAGKTLTVDLYASQASSSTMVYDDIAILGQVRPVPEPAAAVFLGAAAFFSLRRRSR
jgi:hypothetical protein